MKISKIMLVCLMLLALLFGVMIGRSFDPIDLAIRKSQKLNKQSNQLSFSLRPGGTWNLFGLISPYKTLVQEIQKNPKTQKKYLTNLTNQIRKKEEAIEILSEQKELIALAKQELLIDQLLQQYLYSLGKLQIQNGMIYEAVTNLQTAHYLAPDDIKTIQLLSMAYISLYQLQTTQKDKEEISEKVIKYSKIALLQNPYHLDTLYGLGLTYTDLGKLELGLESFEQILERDPENINALLGSARIYFDQNNIDKARIIYEQAEALILERLSQKKLLRKSLNNKFELEQKLSTIHKNMDIINNISLQDS